MAESVDPLLPSRLRRLAFISRFESLVAGAWFRVVQSFTDTVRPTVMNSYRESGGTVPPSPAAGFGTASQSLWDDRIDEDLMPVIRETVKEPWDGAMSHAPEDVSQSFDQDPIVVDYLRDSRNRLRHFPDELYGRLQGIIARGLEQGRSIDDVAEDVRQLLTATGNDTYRNRARTVARTETISATNAGALASAHALAEVTGDANPEKIWLATEGDRTRETHRLADGQRVPLSETFVVGGFNLQFPGDPSGPPQEVINCRCTILHVTKGEELDWTDREYSETAEDLWDDYDLEQELENEDG